jgi:aspartate aminotransferase-like enzyme
LRLFGTPEPAGGGARQLGVHRDVRVPDGIDGAELVALLRTRFGVTLAGGQGPLKGKVFRIGHIGYYDVFDITTALAAVELVLTDLGAEIERGAAVTRALEAYDERARV